MTNRRLTAIAVFCFILMAPVLAIESSAFGAMQLTVGQGGGFDFNTIQGAINAASSGDTIVVSPGTYTGSVNFLTKDIHLVTTNPFDAGVRAATIIAPPTPIDVSTNGSLEGFRINGELTFGYNNYPDIRSFSPKIKNNHIVSNDIAIDILVGYIQPPPVPIIENNVIEARLGVYIFVQAFGQGMEGAIRNNTFFGPGAVGTGSAGILYRMHQEKPEVSNNVISNFVFGWLLTYHSKEEERKAKFSYNNVFGNGSNYSFGGDETFDMTGVQGNISVDPLFMDPTLGDFRLRPDSPMIDAGWNAGTLKDIRGASRPYDVPGIDNNGAQPEFDIGAYEYVPEPGSALLFLLGMATLRLGRLPRQC